MNHIVEDSLLPQCCNSGCTTCVLDYPELYLGTIDPELIKMVEAVENADLQTAEIEEP